MYYYYYWKIAKVIILMENKNREDEMKIVKINQKWKSLYYRQLMCGRTRTDGRCGSRSNYR